MEFIQAKLSWAKMEEIYIPDVCTIADPISQWYSYVKYTTTFVLKISHVNSVYVNSMSGQCMLTFNVI